MSDEKSMIDYDAKVQDALRSVVKTVLRETAEDGLQGDHHFYIAFKTRADGVKIPEHLSTRFPDEMTIVLQHKFWGLKVEETHFEVGLSFNQQPELLIIPFEAVVGFVDPSVQFALQFNDDADAPESTIQPAATDYDDLSDADAEQGDAPADNSPTDDGSNVVALDAFRKK